ncbi:MAG: hypothetical protein FWD53_06605 [Phycisphaerales bacterium]|nr:hypothetical protein [Phycisphaerales bacterium]
MQEPSGGSTAKQAEQARGQSHDKISWPVHRRLQLAALNMQGLVAQVTDNVALPHERVACMSDLSRTIFARIHSFRRHFFPSPDLLLTLIGELYFIC